ncbi:AMMECR1 [Carpediemonas membranifera]|uniref:AMMECR1 n=1 Tax=Carpediemonas membranifera TaxID=201153 RepID=A0A8J6BTN2_9EUKA|nr:AMMECR1 [Carpediemonas membranifera]|eukprot:KAG9389526.1 AMMECR1 [Carpediemonas membranifera]
MADIAANENHCITAFDALRSAVEKKIPIRQNYEDHTCPLFVTWHKLVDGRSDLRGCIGNLSGLSIKDGIPQYAVIAGTQDHRFNPITPSELPSLEVCVSLLVKYEKCENPLDWAVGTHGIIIKWDGYSAVFLPEVAFEQGWDRETTLQHLIRKAGYRAPLTPGTEAWDALLAKIETVRYQSSRYTMSWEEYLKK